MDSENLFIFRDMVVKFLEKEVLPNIDEWENQKILPKDLWRVMGDAGLLAVDMPEEFGSAGAEFEIDQMIIEEMSRMGLLGLAVSYTIHSSIVAPYINNIGTQEQKENWLPKMISGEVIGAIAMTEPGAGSDLASMRTTAVRDGDDYIINGSKTFITNGHNAGLVIVCAKTDPTAGSKGISLFLVDTSLEGFSTGKMIDKIGQYTSDTAELFFDNLKVSKAALLGGEGNGFKHLMNELPRERLGIAVSAIGHAQGALDLTVDYVRERKAFGQSISQFQNTRFKLAEVKTRIELCRHMVKAYISKYKAKQMTVEDAAMVKYASTEAELFVVNECLQLFGGYGYTSEYPISKFYRDARVQTIYAGTSEIMKEVIARGVLDN